MKNLDLKSLIAGGLIAFGGLIFIGSAPVDADDEIIEFVPHPGGVGIYNQETKTLYLYKMWNLKLAETPYQTFSVGDDGKTMVEIK